MIETALKCAPKNVDGEHPRKLLGEVKATNNGVASPNNLIATVDGYTWSYRVRNGEATIMAEKDGKHSCAVSPAPTGDFKIPAALGGVKVTRIGTDAFRNCKELTSVTIPESVTNIGGIAFIGCDGLKSITIPSRVKSIGEHVFERCSELTEVTMLGERPQTEKDNIFSGCGKLKAIHVPANAKSWAGMKDWFGIPLVFDAK